MTVVVIIIGILILFSTAQLDGLIPKYRFRETIREIGATLKLARSRAVSSGMEVYMEYDLSNGTYCLLVPFTKRDEETEEPNGNELTAGQNPVNDSPANTPPPGKKESEYVYNRSFSTKFPEDVEFVNVIFAKGEIIDRGIARIKISPFGFSDHHIVNLRNKDGDNLAVKLNGFTGGLTFYDEIKEPDVLLEDE